MHVFRRLAGVAGKADGDSVEFCALLRDGLPPFVRAHSILLAPASNENEQYNQRDNRDDACEHIHGSSLEFTILPILVLIAQIRTSEIPRHCSRQAGQWEGFAGLSVMVNTS